MIDSVLMQFFLSMRAGKFYNFFKAKFFIILIASHCLFVCLFVAWMNLLFQEHRLYSRRRYYHFSVQVYVFTVHVLEACVTLPLTRGAMTALLIFGGRRRGHLRVVTARVHVVLSGSFTSPSMTGRWACRLGGHPVFSHG